MSRLRCYRNVSVGIIFMMSISNPAHSQEGWYKCQTADDCALVKGDCGLEWAVNKDFIQQSRNTLLHSGAECSKPIEFHPEKTFVICVDSQCALYPSGSYAGGAPIDKENCIIASCWGHLGCNYLTCTKSDGSQYTKYAH